MAFYTSVIFEIRDGEVLDCEAVRAASGAVGLRPLIPDPICKNTPLTNVLSGQIYGDNARHVRDRLVLEMKRIFSEKNLAGAIHVCVGNGWATEYVTIDNAMVDILVS